MILEVRLWFLANVGRIGVALWCGVVRNVVQFSKQGRPANPALAAAPEAFSPVVALRSLEASRKVGGLQRAHAEAPSVRQPASLSRLEVAELGVGALDCGVAEEAICEPLLGVTAEGFAEPAGATRTLHPFQRVTIRRSNNMPGTVRVHNSVAANITVTLSNPKGAHTSGKCHAQGEVEVDLNKMSDWNDGDTITLSEHADAGVTRHNTAGRFQHDNDYRYKVQGTLDAFSVQGPE